MWPVAGWSPASAGGGNHSGVRSPTTRWRWGCWRALHEEGRDRVPDDVSVVGFDDLPEAPYYVPPLTTVRQDFAEFGRRGVQAVLARLAGEDLHPDPVPAPLLVRASTGPTRLMKAAARD